MEWLRSQIADGAEAPADVRCELHDAARAVAAAVVLRCAELLKDSGMRDWVDRCLLGIGDAAAGGRDSLSQALVGPALCVLVVQSPRERALREGLVNWLWSAESHDVGLLYQAAAALWRDAPTLVWGLMSLGVIVAAGRARDGLGVRRGRLAKHWTRCVRALLADKAPPKPPWSLRSGSLPLLCSAEANAVGIAIPEVLDAIPVAHWRQKCIELVTDWYCGTCSALRAHGDGKRSGRSTHADWWPELPRDAGRARAAGRLACTLPPDEAYPRLVEPIPEDWADVAPLLDVVLYATLVGFREDDTGFVPFWRRLVSKLLRANPVAAGARGRRTRLGHEVRNVLHMLVLQNPSGIGSPIDPAPVADLTDEIGLWCASVAHNADCLPALAGLLGGVGFALAVDPGLAWIDDALERSGDPVDLIRDSRTALLLSRLLDRMESECRGRVVAGSAIAARFDRILDRVVAAGDALAAEIQRRRQ